MVTKVLSGSAPVVTSGADLFDARKLNVELWAGRVNMAVDITSAPDNAKMIGGVAIAPPDSPNFNLAWRDLYDVSGGRAMRVSNAKNFVVEGFKTRGCWDGPRPGPRTPGWTLSMCWCDEVRDDCIENDDQNDVIIKDCLLQNLHTLTSASPGGPSPITENIRFEFYRNVISFGNHLTGGKPVENRDKRLYAWSDFTNGSGQFNKSRDIIHDQPPGSVGVDILFQNNHVMVKYGINQSGSNLPFFQDYTVLPGSTGNVFYYLGNYKGLTKVAFKGGFVPKEFRLDEYPDVWTRVSNSEEEWLDAVSLWKVNVWEPLMIEYGNMDPPPPPPPPPPPDCDCEDLQNQIDALQSEVVNANIYIEKLETAIAAAVADLNTVLE